MKEPPEARKERQAQEEWQMIEVLRRAGNLVEPEAKIPNEKHPAYPFRIDYLLNRERAFGHPVALEIQGIGFGHASFSAIQRTYRKHNTIAALGYRIVQVTREMVGNGDALEALAKAGVAVEP